MSLEHWNNFENQYTVVKTGVSEPKEFKKPSDNLDIISQSEKMDNFLDWFEIWLKQEEKDEIINMLFSKFWKNENLINSVLENIKKDNDVIYSKNDIVERINLQEVQSNVQEVQSNVQEVYKAKEPLFKNLEQILSWVELEWESGQNIKEMLKKWDFDKVIETLKNPDTFESVVWELEQKDPEKYKQFKETLISIDPSFRESFDKYDYREKETSKILDLGTPKISSDWKSWETTDWKHNIKIDDKWYRYLSSKDSPYQLKSNLDNKQNIELNQKIDTDLENTLNPINEKLNSLSSILDYLEMAISKNIDLKDIKETIKKTDINLYNEYNIENLNSPNDIKNIITQSIKKLEDDKKTAIEKAKNLKRELILKNTKEASEKDETIKQLLKFLTSIGFDRIPQNKLENIIKFINFNPQIYWLQEKIDFENWILWFNKDFWDKKINPAEKKAFIQLFNRMLWENIVDENIAFGITTLSIPAIMRIQILSNKTTWFFMENLGKREEKNKDML